MKSSLEIAQEHELIPIEQVAERAGLEADEIEPCGRHKAKVSLSGGGGRFRLRGTRQLPLPVRRRRADPGQDRERRQTCLRCQEIYYYPEAEAKLRQFTRDGLGHYPVCMAKTHLSLSADATLLHAPDNFTLPARDIRAYTGAGWLVPLCGEIVQMPGLSKAPAALNVDVDAEGRTV